MRARNANRHARQTAFEPLEPRCLLDASPQLLEPFVHPDRNIHAVETADFDGDGDLDLVVWASEARAANPWKSVLVLLLNDGNGKLERTARRLMRQPAGALAAGDFDGDGIAELATSVTGPGESGSLLRFFRFDSETGRLERSRRQVLEHDTEQLESIPAGGAADSLLLVEQTFADNLSTAEGRILRFDGPGLPSESVIFTLTAYHIGDIRVVDADGDAHHDLLIRIANQQSSTNLYDAHILLYRQDPVTPGVFGDAEHLLTFETGDLVGSSLLTDVDQDGLLDLVVTAREGFGALQVLLYSADASGFLAPIVLHEIERNYPEFARHTIVGSGTGPTGSFELWIAETTGVFGFSLPGSSTSALIRLVQQIDGEFETRTAFAGFSHPARKVTALFHPAHLTSDSAMDFIAITGQLSALTSPNSSTVILTFDSANRPPLLSPPVVHNLSAARQRPAVNGDTILFRAVVFDPESLIGEAGGIRRMRFFIDVNGNGTIDEGDFRVARGTPTFFQRTVRAHWPRGAFNILVQARDVHGNLSEIHTAAQSLTII